MAVDTAALQAIINTDLANIALWQTALAAEAVNPLEDYSVDGETTTPGEWRASLSKCITDAMERIEMNNSLILKLTPYCIRTRVVV